MNRLLALIFLAATNIQCLPQQVNNGRLLDYLNSNGQSPDELQGCSIDKEFL